MSCTTIVRSGVLFLGALGGGGWGTSASKPFGVSGVITMKMMSSTSSTSMSGVTLIFALWPPPVPTAILMVESPLLPTRRSGRRCIWRAFSLLSKQAQIIHTGRAHRIHYLDHIAEVGAGICLNVDHLVRTIGQAIFHLASQAVHHHLVRAEVDRPITHHRHQKSVFFVGILHGSGVVHLGHIHADALLQHGRDHHE